MLSRRKRIVVLGAGPAGLLAAHAARMAGYSNVVVASAPDPREGLQAKKSDLYGCQYLHQHIPGLDMGVTGKEVQYLLDGTADGYRAKVYGDNWSGEVSPDEYGPTRNHLAWDLRRVYDLLWQQWGEHVLPIDLTPRMTRAMLEEKKTTFLITVPAPALCLDMENHKFASQGIWAMGSYPGRQMPYIPPDMTVMCNGQDAPRWYRAATVFGHTTVEWPAGVKPPINGVAAVNKPLSTDCTCHLRDGVHRLGRYGQWRKGVLVHQAYTQTRKILW